MKMMTFFLSNGLLIAAALAGCSSDQVKKPVAEIKTLPQYHVVYVEYKGDFENNPEIYDIQLEKLLSWAVPAGLWDFPDKTKLIVIYPDDPYSTPKSEQRMLMAITVPQNVSIPSKIEEMTIPGGKYAVGNFIISSEEFSHSWEYMYSDFIPGSGYVPADGLSFEKKMNDSDTHPEKKHIVEICIPVEKK